MENYDPSMPVCDNQDDFNRAFRNAVKYNMNKNEKKARPWMTIYAILYIVFLIWAFSIVCKNVLPGPDRVLHMLFALLFAPAYVLVHYLARMC